MNLPNDNFTNAASKSPVANRRQKASTAMSKSRPTDCSDGGNPSYMKVIRESNASILQRQEFRNERQRILNMSFDKAVHRKEWSQLNNYLTQKAIPT